MVLIQLILDGARIGKKCRIFPSSVVSGIPQDLKFRGEETTAEIGDNTTIREGVTVNRGTAAVGKNSSWFWLSAYGLCPYWT